MPFQRNVRTNPAPAVAGDFAGANPRVSLLAPAAGYQAAPDLPAVFGGVPQPALTVGRFAWGDYAAGLMANYIVDNARLGFVHREQGQTIIVDFLGEQDSSIQQGFPATSQVQGDYWADFGVAGAVPGQTVYADPVTGAASAGAAGGAVKFAITASLAATGILTVTVTGGVLAVGQVVTNAAGTVPRGSFITAQLTGAAGSTGTYQLNQGAVVGSGAMTAYGKQDTGYKVATPVPVPASFTGAIDAGGVLTVSALTGVVSVDQTVSGSGVPAGTLIQGGAGANKFQTNYHAVVASTAMTANGGTLGKISTWQA